jgi:hypothetical protein
MKSVLKIMLGTIAGLYAYQYIQSIQTSKKA